MRHSSRGIGARDERRPPAATPESEGGERRRSPNDTDAAARAISGGPSSHLVSSHLVSSHLVSSHLPLRRGPAAAAVSPPAPPAAAAPSASAAASSASPAASSASAAAAAAAAAASAAAAAWSVAGALSVGGGGGRGASCEQKRGGCRGCGGEGRPASGRLHRGEEGAWWRQLTQVAQKRVRWGPAASRGRKPHLARVRRCCSRRRRRQGSMPAGSRAACAQPRGCEETPFTEGGRRRAPERPPGAVARRLSARVPSNSNSTSAIC